MRHRPCVPLRASLLASAILVAAGMAHAAVPAPVDTPYAPGTVTIKVDATDLPRRIMRVEQTVPVVPGPLSLLLPQWLPGNHAPSGPIDRIAGLEITANGAPLRWTRDPLNVFAFNVDVPAGVDSLSMRYQYLTPSGTGKGGVAMTPNMLNLKWNAVVLYPAGHYASQIPYSASVRYPAGWQSATALDVASRNGDTVQYATIPLDILVDSPVFAGRNFRRIDLAPGARVPVHLNVVADTAAQLEAKPEHIAQHVALVEQAVKLFGAQHYDHYDFLFSLSDQLGGNGLEHQRSSENGVGPDYFSKWDAKVGSTDLLAHEFVHSWNGKYRRGADLWTPNFNVPMQDSLMWVYEGQTQYWGDVLAARSGLRPQQAARDKMALVAATYGDNRPGLAWRSIQDTTNDPIISRRGPKPYRNWQLSEDYYVGGQLIWLEADARIRKLSGGRKSLDDFARAFFGQDDGVWKTQHTYVFDDVVAALNDVAKDDWATFLRARLDGEVPITGGIEASGWKLVYRDKPTDYAKAQQAKAKGATDYTYSIGLSLDKDNTVVDTRWDGPAFNAGIGTDMTLLAVNGLAIDADTLGAAITAAVTDKAPLVFTIKDFNTVRTVDVDYHGGLRYPHLERIAGTPDYLEAILKAKR